MYKMLIGKPEGQTPIGRRKRRWNSEIEMDVIESE